MSLFNQSAFIGPVFGGMGTVGANTNFLLFSAYVLGVSGTAVGVRFVAPPGNVSIKYVYVFLGAVNASDLPLTCDLTPYGPSTTRPGTSYRTVTAAGGTTANKWIKFDFSAYPGDILTRGNVYWAVIGDIVAGHGYGIRSRASSRWINNINAHLFMFTSTVGFSTNGAAVTPAYPIMIVFSDGTVFGHPYTQGTLDASSTLERGMKFSFTEKMQASGLIIGTTNQNISTLQIYEGASIPGSAVWSGFNGGAALALTSDEKNVGVVNFPAPVTFAKNTVYRVTLMHLSANTAPGYNECEDIATPGQDAIACSLGQGSWCHTMDNGAGGWMDCNDTSMLRLAAMGLIIVDQLAGSGGAGPWGMVR